MFPKCYLKNTVDLYVQKGTLPKVAFWLEKAKWLQALKNQLSKTP